MYESVVSSKRVPSLGVDISSANKIQTQIGLGTVVVLDKGAGWLEGGYVYLMTPHWRYFI